MVELELPDVIDKLEQGELNYYQFYNAEINSDHHYSIDHYTRYGERDNLDVDQELKVVFIDLEVFKCELDKLRNKQATGIINSVCVYDSHSQTYYLFSLLMMTQNYSLVDTNDPGKYEKQFKEELVAEKYLKASDKLRVFFYVDEELKMLEDIWRLIHQIDPTVLSGFNFNNFDLPYIYYRLKYLYNDDIDKVANTLSKFGVVKARSFGFNNNIEIAEYPVADIRQLYIPRSENGLNYGKSLSKYSLNFIAEEELGIKKIEHQDLSFDQFYTREPVEFFKYNIADVSVCVQLNDKLKHIELHNLLRRDMKTSFTASLIGSSSFFSTMFNYELKKKSLGMRFGLLQEQAHSIGQEEIDMIERPKEKSVKWNITSIDQKTYRKIMSRFVGAYVKEGLGKTLTINDGILVDMDASLPPEEKIFIRKNNIKYSLNVGDYEWEENDETLTWNKNNEVCWKRVKGKTEHDWNGKLIKLLTNCYEAVTVTDNHSIFSSLTNNINDIKLVNAGELKIGNYIVVRSKINNQIILEKIKSIEVIDYTGKVYDLTVEETERFFAGSGIGVHNTALYPSMMRQSNISFDSYFGRVIDPVAYKFINTVSNAIEHNQDIIPQLKTMIFNEIKKSVERLDPQNKNNHKQYIYIIFMKLLKDILNAKVPIKQLLTPTTQHEYLLLKSYLLPLLDILTEIMKVPEYHTFAYNYILNFDETTNPWVLIVENENDYNCCVKKVDSVNFGKYLVDKQLSFNLSGAIFATHEKHKGILNHFLTERLALRSEYKTKRDTFPHGSNEYQFFDRRQLSMKINANSSYGLTGMASFLFSNRQLAMSTTLSGRLCLKISQACGELYLNNLEKELM